MKKNYSQIYSSLFITAFIIGLFYFMMPQTYDKNETSLKKFSTNRALDIVKEISKKPHYIGSDNHEEVAQYIEKELQNLGLETYIQEGFTLTDWGNLVKSKNIIARIKGQKNTKALLLLSHYDSAPHSFSKGASDDAVGIATILESIRAFQFNKTKHKNDIIILFTDAEELGLNGAALFVTEHKWANEIGLALNLEARGTSGPSFMLMETNKGNSKMVEGFSKANIKYPVTNSLMYSIYKMLPNDTDLTVFREKGKIQGFNFAFIDDHYNYHTTQDDFEHLNPKSLAHQGTYLVPLINYYSNTDLTNLDSTEDKVYFSAPFTFVSYPFSWILPILEITFILFFALLFIGLAKKLFYLDDIIKSFIPFFKALFTAGVITYLGWHLIKLIYPQYKDILQGFTYNGHDYISAFVCISLAICFFCYRTEIDKHKEMSLVIAPIFIWLIINTIIAFVLEGAGFLILPVISSLLMLTYYVFTQKTNQFLFLLLSIPTLVLIVPFIQMFPIGLGLKILAGSVVLVVLSFSLLLPIFGTFSNKKIWSLIFIAFAILFFVKAHFNSDYEYGKAKPNSLVYMLNSDTKKAYWTTYDKNLDAWTKAYLGNQPKNADELNSNRLFSKYKSSFTYMSDAPVKKINKPIIEFVYDFVKKNFRHLKIKITPNRKVNRYDIFADESIKFYNLRANNVKSLEQKNSLYPRDGKKILSYYVVDQLPLELEFSIPENQALEMSLIESSFDLLSNPEFKISPRKPWMIPTPFVLNDAVSILQKIKPTPILLKKPEIKINNYKKAVIKDTLSTTNETD